MKQKLSEQELMGQAPIGTAVAQMAIPSIISQLVTIVYNMADTFFVGQTGDSLQVAAVSFTNPCFIFMMAIANVLGMGGSALLSASLGAKNEERARRTSAFVLYGSIIAGVIIAAVLLIFQNPILRLFGADKTTIGFARSYVRWIAVGAPFIIWSAAASFVVRSAGASKEAMIGNMIGTIANIILDPIFISVWHQGAGGAAIATTLGNIMASVYYIWYFRKHSEILSLKPGDFSLTGALPANLVKTGLPTGLLSALMSVSTIILNQILVAYGNDAVAAIGIVFKANMFIAFFQMGIANGVQPILGYCYGAGNEKRFRTVERYTAKLCIITGSACTALFFIFRTQIIRLFINDQGVIACGVPMLVGYMLSGPFIGILFLIMDCLQSVERPFPATVLSILRQGAILIPLLYILNAVAGFNGVILGQSITDYITIALAIVMWKKVRKELWEKPQARED